MQFDIAIIGGGMVGATLANALRFSPLKIALIDATPLVTSEDHRLIALNHSSYCLLQNIGVWEKLTSHAAPIKAIHVSHRGQFGISRLTAKEYEINALGYVVPAKIINHALEQNLKQVSILRPAKLIGLEQHDNMVNLSIKTGAGLESITAKFVIGADGTQSAVRALLNIPTDKLDYEQSALVTTTQLQRSHAHIAYERFQEQGAIAMLPLADNQVATIWTDHRTIISDLMQLSDDDFLKKLQTHFGYRLGRLLAVGKRYVYPLQKVQAKQQIKQNIILIGNAAHTVHPIAAQGLNLALYEIALLAEQFLNKEIENISLTDLSLQQQRFGMQLSHHLKGLFAQDFFLLNKIRQAGMIGFDLFPTLKNYFMRRALGRTGKIPTLLMEQEVHETIHT